MPASTIQRQNSRLPWNSGSRGTNRRDRSLDDKKAAEDRGMIACASSLYTKNFPGRTATDTCNRKPVNSAIYLHVAEYRQCGQFARTCRSLELLRDGKEKVSLSVSRFQPSTSKHVLRPNIFCASNKRGVPWTTGVEQLQMIQREGLYHTS